MHHNGTFFSPTLRRQGLRKGEEDTHDGPIRQPLYVISRTRALQGLEAEIGRYDPTEDGGEETGTDVEEDEDGKESGEAEDAVGFGDLGLLFEPLQGRVLGQLCEAITNEDQRPGSVRESVELFSLRQRTSLSI